VTPGERFGVPRPGGTSVSHVRVYDSVGPSALDALYRSAVDLLGERPSGRGALLAGDPSVDLERSRAQVASLTNDDRSTAAATLRNSAIRSRSLHPTTRAMGCCGTLGTLGTLGTVIH